MSGLLALLQQSAMSLQAQTAASSTASHNLSNANTAGFSRQRAEIAAESPAERIGNSYLGRGAVLYAITQARDRFIENQIPGVMGRQTASSAESETLQTVTAIDVDQGLAPAMSNFYTQLRALAQNPSSLNYRSAAVGAANQLALTFNRTSNAIEAARTGIDAKVEGRLTELNESIAQVARLNGAINEARAAGGEPNDLLDARLRLGDRLAQMVGAVAVPTSSGDLNLTLPDGTSLVAGTRASRFSITADSTNLGHSKLYLQKPDGSAPQALAHAPGGELGGLLAARDGALKTSSAQIDQLAFEFSGLVNTASAAGFALDGSTGHALFQGVTTVTGAARGISIDSAIAGDPALMPGGNSTAPGDSSAVQAMIDTESAPLTGGADVSAALARITSDFGAAAQRAATMNEGDTAMLGHLEGMRDSTSGVSIDEELVNMQKAQRAYEAVTRVIKTADEMLETLMSLK